MKRSGSASLASVFPVKRQSGTSSNGTLKKAEHAREARSGRGNRGLDTAPAHSGSREMSLDGLLGSIGEQAGQAEVTSPPPRALANVVPRLTPQPQREPLSPRRGGGRAQAEPPAFSSPFAAWRQCEFGAAEGQPSGRGRQLMEDIAQLATPTAGVSAAEGDAGLKPEENDENVNWLVSPVRPPRRALMPAALLQTPEKEGLSSLQPMPSLSSWMVPATKPPPPHAEPASALSDGAMDDVLASLSFNPSQPRKMERPPSPLERLLGEMGDSDYAASVAGWDEEGQQAA